MTKLDNMINKEFEGLTGIFILPKIKAYILKIFPLYVEFFLDLMDKEKKFKPEEFGFKLTAGNLQDSFFWKKDNIEIFNYKRLNLPSIYKINCKPPEKDLYYETQTLYFNTELYLGAIPNKQFAKELFKNLGISK